MRLLTPNHVALIESCYPPGATLLANASDLAPKTQETSRLVYYASNRSGKLRKLGAELERKGKIEVSRAAGGNMRYRGSLLITLAIFKALATECKQELSLLTPYLMQIVSLTFLELPSDLEVVAKATSVLTTWCSFADGGSIGVDDGVTKAYLQCLSRAASFAVANAVHSLDTEMQNRKRLVGLAVLNAVVESDVLYRSTVDFQAQVNVLVPPLIQNLRGVRLDVLQKQGILDNGHPLPVSPYLSEFRPGLSQKRAPSIHVHVDGEQGPSDIDVVHTSVHIFSALLQRSRAGQVSQCLNATFDHLDKDSLWTDQELYVWIIESVTEWTQYQYRFTVPTKIVQRVMAMQDSSEVLTLLGLLRMLNNVLSSRTALNNISTSDVITQLIAVMMRRTAQNPADSLLDELACCISATGTHIYYADQIQDLANELISKLVSVQIHGPLGASRRASEESRIKALTLLLKSLKGLMEVAGGHEFQPKNVARRESRQTRSAAQLQGDGEMSSTIPEVLQKERLLQRSRIDPEVWQESLTLLCEDDFSIRSAYTGLLVHYLTTELAREVISPLQSMTGARPSLTSSDSIIRFLHALHASVFSLATTNSLGLLSPKHSRNGSTQEFEIALDSTKGDDVGKTSRNGKDNSITEGDAVSRKVEGHQLSINFTLLDKPDSSSVTAMPREGEAATASDYINLACVLKIVHEHLPTRGLIVGVPMLIALGNAAETLAQGETQVLCSRMTAIFEVLLTTWRVIGSVWNCTEVRDIIDEVSCRLVPKRILPEVLQVQEGTTTEFASNNTTISVDPLLPYDTILALLSSNTRIHSATGLDGPTILRTLTRAWTMESALKDSVERFSSQDTRLLAGPSPLIKLSPQLMHIENLSLSSLARSLRGVGAGDLREALEGKSAISGIGLASASTSTFENVVHANTGTGPNLSLHRTRSRGSAAVTSHFANKESPHEFLSKLGIGKDNSNSLLKASFPPLHKSSLETKLS